MSFPGQSLQRAWHLVDAKNQTVGRLAGQISQILRGKHKPTFRANKDMGDHVVVINAEKVGGQIIGMPCNPKNFAIPSQSSFSIAVCLTHFYLIIPFKIHRILQNNTTKYKRLMQCIRSNLRERNGTTKSTDGTLAIPVDSRNEQQKT